MGKTSCFVLLAAVSVFISAGISGREILDRTVNRMDFDDACFSVQVTRIKKSGREKRFEFTIFQKNYPEMTTTLARVEDPEEAQGISFLTWDYKDEQKQDEKWYYLPALKEYQRLSDERGKTYEEKFGFSMDVFSINLDDAEHRLLGEEDIDGNRCYKVESRMKNPDHPQGARAVTWVRKDNWLTAKLQAFDKQDQMIKEYELIEMEKVGDIWMETEGRYKDIQKGRTIEFKIKNPQLNTGLKDEIFLASSNPREVEAP
jgi:hypothetical protein